MYERIRDLREENNLTQEQVAKTLHVSQATYSRYESGFLDIPSHVLISLASLYKKSVDYILGLTERE